MSTAITIQNVSRGFPNTPTVLNNLSGEIPQGGIFVILGHSGCGKSTLLRILGGFDRPDSGRVLLGDEPVTRPRPDMFMMFQSYEQLFPWKTLRGNLVFALQGSGVERDAKKAAARADLYLSKAGLAGYENAYPHTLSGGMKQRGALARALCLAPKVLLMDEPLSSWDFLTRRAMQSLLKELQQEAKTTVVLVTHDIDEAVRIGDTVAMLTPEGKLTLCEKSIEALEGLLAVPKS